MQLLLPKSRVTFSSFAIKLIFTFMNLRQLFGLKPKADIKQIYKNGAIVIDVRTPMEYQAGHFGKSSNIPLNKIDTKIDFLKSKNKPIILICRSGGRAGTATNILKSAGVEVYNGGGWESFRMKVRS